MENKDRKGIPTIEEAGKLNPGPWIDHSNYVGKAAQNCDGRQHLKLK